MVTQAEHNEFNARLALSSDAVFAVARWYYDNGVLIEIPPLRQAATFEAAQKLKDHGDIIVISEDGRRQSINVKHLRTTNFTEDHWPYPVFFISRWEVIMSRPCDYYLSVSQDLQYAVLVKTEDARPHWKKVDGFNRVVGRQEQYAAIDRSLVKPPLVKFRKISRA